MTLPRTQKPTLQFVFTTEFGDKTEVIKELTGSHIEDLFWAFRDCLAACGYDKENINEWLPCE
jgi:hypothetical protein